MKPLKYQMTPSFVNESDLSAIYSTTDTCIEVNCVEK